MSEESIVRGIETLTAFSALLKEHKVDQIRAVATSVVRESKNGKDFIRRVKETAGLDVDVIDGEEEALLSLKGALSCIDLKTPDALVFDIGGGSTEYILSKHSAPLYSESLKLGVVHATETYLRADPPKKEEIERLSSHVEEKLGSFIDNLTRKDLRNNLPPGNPSITLVGTAGTITTLAAMDQGLEEYDPSKINNYILNYDRVKRLFDLLSPLSISERRRFKALEGGREDLIVAGSVIVLKTMELFEFDRMMVSDGGLLEGVMMDIIERRIQSR